MRKETIEALVKLIENKAKSDSLKRMQLSFFGGEPLIKFHEIVKPIIEKGSEICNKYKKELMVGITTNGVCLTPAVIKDLKKLQIILAYKLLSTEINKFMTPLNS